MYNIPTPAELESAQSAADQQQVSDLLTKISTKLRSDYGQYSETVNCDIPMSTKQRVINEVRKQLEAAGWVSSYHNAQFDGAYLSVSKAATKAVYSGGNQHDMVVVNDR